MASRSEQPKFPRGLSDFSARSTRKRDKLRKFKDDPSASRRHANIDTPDEHWLCGCYLETESTWGFFFLNKASVFSQCSCSVGGKRKSSNPLFTDDCQISTQTAQMEATHDFVAMTQVVGNKVSLKQDGVTVATAKTLFTSSACVSK